jgi:SAM-dependent methyltransferase
LHPQWLLGRKSPPPTLQQATGTLLDIGAADRWISSHLPGGVHYIALDHPATAMGLYGLRPDVFADGAQLPFATGSIDCITCLEVLEHVPDPAIVIAEISRVLVRGGRGWISMPFLYPIHDAPFDFQRYTPYGMQRDLRRAGLTVTASRRSGRAIHTAGLLACLAIAGGVERQRTLLAALLLPIAALMILLVNCAAWTLGVLWPDWDAMGHGYQVDIVKP